MASGERELIAWIRGQAAAHPDVLVGIGDDAAVLRPRMHGGTPAGIVVTTDTLTEGVDFRLASDAPERIGRKALAVNLSDLAAMAAIPSAAFVSLVLPRNGDPSLAQQLMAGMFPLASEFNIAIAGGDTNSWDGGLVIGVTAIGHTTQRGPLLRSGARPGDAILVTGQFGGSILGHQFDFTPRVKEALLLAERYTLHAGMDCSDGLSLDLSRLCQESGCGAVLEADRIPIANAAFDLAKQRSDGQTPLDHALSDGEDFELILAVPPEEAERMLADTSLGFPVASIGQFTDTPGLQIADSQGNIHALTPRGWEHGWSGGRPA